MISKRRKAREVALKVLYQIDLVSLVPEEAFRQVMDEEVFRPSLEPFIAELLHKNHQEQNASNRDDLKEVLLLEVLDSRTREGSAALFVKSGEKIFSDPSRIRDFQQRVQEKIHSFDTIQAFAHDLVSRTTENLANIDKILAKYADHWSLDRMATLDRAILRFAVCELLNFREIPVNVTINEAVELAKKFSTERSREFVNGILDKVQREFKPEKDDPRQKAAQEEK